MIRLVTCIFCTLHLILAQNFVDVEKYIKENNDESNLNWNVEQHINERSERAIERDEYTQRFQAQYINFTAARIIGGSDISAQTYPWVAIIMQGTTYKGIAGIVNTYWAICNYQIVTGAADSSLTLYEGISDYSAIPATAEAHISIQIYRHTTATTTRDSLALIRVCPGFTSVATLPATGTSFTGGTNSFFLNYQQTTGGTSTKLQRGTKNVAADNCECDAIPDFTAALNTCLEQSVTIYNNPNIDLGSLLVINNEFVGINIVPGNQNGEVYINLAAYRDWINTNARYI